MSSGGTTTLTVKKLQAWSRRNRALAENVLKAQALAEITRERVDAYIAPIFARYQFKDDSGQPIAAASKLYKCDDDAACAAFYAECDAAHRAHGFTGAIGECPALIAEDLLTKAQNALVDSLCGLAGVDHWYTLEHRAKALEIALGACFARE